MTKLKNLLLQNPLDQFQLNLTQSILGWRGFKFASSFKWRAPSFKRGDNYEIVKIHWRNLKIFFYRTTGPISTKLNTKHPWVKGIQVCSNEGPHLFPRGHNYEIVKIHWRNLKIFFSRTTGPISTQFGTKHPWVKEIQVCSNEEPINSQLIMFFSSLNQYFDIIICVYWFELFSQVSDVAHGPLVLFYIHWLKKTNLLIFFLTFEWIDI